MKADEFLKWGAILGGVYLAYEIVQKLGSIGHTASEVGSQVAELGDRMADPTNATWVSWYDPTTRTVFFYVLTFPDGSQHWIWGSSVNADGTFVWGDNYTYRIGTDRAGGLRAYPYQVT